MSSGEALYLAMAIAAFFVFAIVLAWISETEIRKQRRRPSSHSEPSLRRAA